MNNLKRKIKYKISLITGNNRCAVYIGKVLIIMIIAGVIMFLAEQRISSLAIRLGEVQLENEIRKECNRIAAEILGRYEDDFNEISYEVSGDGVRYIQVNFAKLNNYKCELTDALSEYLKTHNEIVCYVPFGALLSNDIFAAQGANMPIEITSTGTAEVDFLDDFTTGGINQTRHRLMLKIIVKVQLHTVGDRTEKIIEIEIPVTERVTVGEVPARLDISN